MKNKNLLPLLFTLVLLPMIVRGQAPAFTSFGSSTTAGNSNLVINGTNFTGTTSVLFGEIPALFTVNSNTQITATVPKVANTGPVKITNTSGNGLSTSISVTRNSSALEYNSVTASFNGINVGLASAPTFTDLDGDGLLDMLVGEDDANLNHYEQSASNSTSFTLINSNFNSIIVDFASTPTFTDLDGDGLLDMVVGQYDGDLNHYEQNAANSTSFTLITDSFNDINVVGFSTPTFTDLDGDGLLDLIVGKEDGDLSHYEQNAANSTSFTIITSNFSGINVGYISIPTFTDLDGDGLLDLLVGEDAGNLNHYEQNSANSTSFSLITSNFNGINIGGVSTPTFTDLDGDGLLDMIVGELNGNLNHFEQTQSLLPVTWLSFTGSQTKLGNQLKWTVGSEVNNQGFAVEYSTDGKTFNKVGFVKGYGNTNAKQSYQFTDSHLSEGYYRLQQVDLDGKTEYSAIIKLGQNILSSSLQVYPNPAKDKVTIQTNGEGALEILNTLGQVVISQPTTEKNEINITKLAKGVYTVRFNGVGQKLIVK